MTEAKTTSSIHLLLTALLAIITLGQIGTDASLLSSISFNHTPSTYSISIEISTAAPGTDATTAATTQQRQDAKPHKPATTRQTRIRLDKLHKTGSVHAVPSNYAK